LRIATAVCEPGEPLVIEIGPGRGALTKHLLDRAQRVIAIEIDPELVEQLRAWKHPRLEVVHADVLQTDLTQWGRAVIAGNLPYYITSPILAHVLAVGSFCKKGIFLMQKEVGERVMSPPGSREYGYLSVRCQYQATIKRVCAVPAGAFQPPPKVQSAVLSFIPRAMDDPDAERFLEFVGRCFHLKRKNLKNNLGSFYTLPEPFPEATLRAEQLGIPELRQLFERIAK
jgi:16S rRNA (adenine1518-N6/adenine1519-N6)-dimethyltransferase